MTAERKFLFDRSFDPPSEDAEENGDEIEEDEEEEIVVPTFSEEELEIARPESFNAGKEEGIREASDAIEAQTLDTMRALGIQMLELFRHMERKHSETFHESINAAVTIVRKFFPNMVAEHNLTEIEKMLGAILAEILEEPRVILHVNPSISQRLSERVDTIAADAHFEGRVVVMEDEATPPGNCRVEWSNGGAERNLDDLWQQIDAVVEGNLSASDDQAEVEVTDASADSVAPVDSAEAEPSEGPENAAVGDAAAESVPPATAESGGEVGSETLIEERPDVGHEDGLQDSGGAEPAEDGIPPTPSEGDEGAPENEMESTPEGGFQPSDRSPPVPSDMGVESETEAEPEIGAETENEAPEVRGMEPVDDEGILETTDAPE